MALLGFLTGKSKREAEAQPGVTTAAMELVATRTDLEDATVPVPLRSNLADQPSEKVKKVSKSGLRDKLCESVRDSMTHTGLLSSSYKFKVLALDEAGRNYLVMVELPSDHGIDVDRLPEIEMHIARNAKASHDILVSSVFWRISTQKFLSTPKPLPPRNVAPVPAVAQNPIVRTASLPAAAKFDPIGADEVDAFKRAIQKAKMGPVATVAPPASSKSARAALDEEFAVFGDSVPMAPLSSTQFGGL